MGLHMNTFEAIEARRAVKHFDSDYVIPEAEQKKLFELALQSPTSFNIQHWRIVQVKDKALRQQIQAAAWGQEQVTKASMLLFVCANIKAWQTPEKYWRNAPQEVQNMLVPMIKPFYEGKEQLQRDEAMRSVGILAQTLMLAAKGMGYDSCPMIGFDANKVAELIALPQDHAIGLMLTIGKAVKPAWPKPGQLALSEVLSIDRFQ